MAGKLDAAAMAVLAKHEVAPLPGHRETVLRDCLEIAMRELAFVRWPNTVQALRAIQARLGEAGIAVQVWDAGQRRT